MIRKSRYTFLYESKGFFFVYNTARNTFLKVNREIYDFVYNINIESLDVLSLEQKTIADKLQSAGIITTEEDDDAVSDSLRMKNLVSSFSTDSMGLTIAPTLSCNLSCPYCFEKNKHDILMTDVKCDELVTFIKRHKLVRHLYVTWFGGEPLLRPKIIDKLVTCFEKIENLQLVYQEIVTNGTLLNSTVWYLFEKHFFNKVQVTLDGKKNTHNSKRFYRNGAGTYDTIIDNLVEFENKFPNVDISIRVNIDKSNELEFIQVFKELLHIFHGKKNMMIYPGIIKNCGPKSLNSNFLNNYDIVEMIKRHAKNGIKIGYPQQKWNGCGASTLYSYVVGPQGELYKCWEDIGVKDREIGNIDCQKFKNAELFNKYMLYGSHYSDSECMKCSVLPICNKDCPHDRLAKIFENEERELCCIYKDSESIKHMMELFYDSLNKNGKV